MKAIDKCGVCKLNLTQTDVTCEVYDIANVTSISRVHEACYICDKCGVRVSDDTAIFQDDLNLLLCISDYLADALPLDESQVQPENDSTQDAEKKSNHSETIPSSCEESKESPLAEDTTSETEVQKVEPSVDSIAQGKTLVSIFDLESINVATEIKPERLEAEEVMTYLTENKSTYEELQVIKSSTDEEEFKVPSNEPQIQPAWRPYPVQWNGPEIRFQQPLDYPEYHRMEYQHAYHSNERQGCNEGVYFFNPWMIPPHQRSPWPQGGYYEQSHREDVGSHQSQRYDEMDYQNYFRHGARAIVNSRDTTGGAARNASSSPDLDEAASSSSKSPESSRPTRSRSSVKRLKRRKSSCSSESSYRSAALEPDLFYNEANDSLPRKRMASRTPINGHIKAILMTAYRDTSYPDRRTRHRLAMATNLSVRQVQIWFQNQRSFERRHGHRSFDDREILSELGHHPSRIVYQPY